MTKIFFITVTMKNGDRWETTRGTFNCMNTVVQEILKDKDVVKFAVEEK